MLAFLLILLLVIALLTTWLRNKAVRWLFTFLAGLFWIAFLGLLGFVIGYHTGESGLHLTHVLF